MTTIAFDSKSLVSDSRSCIGEMIYEEDSQKLFPKVGPFAILGISGDYQAAMDVLDMIESFTQLDHIRGIPADQIGNVSILGVTYEGTLWSYAGERSCELRMDVPFAVGSGAPYAMAAMDMGYTAEEAVIAASKRDLYTNDVVQVATLFDEDKDNKDKEEESTNG